MRTSGLAILTALPPMPRGFRLTAATGLHQGDRPYQQGRSVDVAFGILTKGIGNEFDASCVQALLRAREKGNVLIQRERAST